MYFHRASFLLHWNQGKNSTEVSNKKIDFLYSLAHISMNIYPTANI